ncbi:hypothetical protein CU097_013479 [Rhizopus azygosporus]|uniref:Uncharacterized protein n=1 Tax=Rhizopus azygosporus TaxID=86630 RepID=A0A367K3W1_RHIAZ|nr:hypothetical protein CU097_013479 [Rhizopus azygosporus]
MILLQPHLEVPSTNRSYQSGQELFLIWAADNKVSPIDLINFLSNMYTSRPYTISTIQLFQYHLRQLCPATTYQIFSNRRPSDSPLKPLSVHTIQHWIGKLVRISTTEPCVSLRPIASSLALKARIPKDDIVTMGNWPSSTGFENHYRREHLSQFDFSNTLIDIDNATDGDDDQFFDAEDNDMRLNQVDYFSGSANHILYLSVSTNSSRICFDT